MKEIYLNVRKGLLRKHNAEINKIFGETIDYT